MRPVLVVLLVLTVLTVGIIVLGANHTSPGEARTEALAYLDRVRPVVERSSATGRDVASLREKLVQLDRTLVDRQLTRAQTDADATLVDARAIPSTAVGSLAQDLLVGALGGRASAVKELRTALEQALNADVPALPAVQALADAGRDLVAADGAYRLFSRNLPPGGEPPPESRWVNDPEAWSIPVLGALVTALRNSKILAAVHDMSVLVAVPEPGPVGKETGGIMVLAQVPVVHLQVVVANNGNQLEQNVPVVAATQPFDGSPSTTKRVVVDLQPGQRRALDTLDLPPPPVGVTFAIIVRVGAAPDSNPVDDEFPTHQYVLR